MINQALIIAIIIVVMLAVIALCFHIHAYKDMRRKRKFLYIIFFKKKLIDR